MPETPLLEAGCTDDVWMVLIPCADAAEARAIGRSLVERRLAACVHLRPHDAIYRWHGEIEEASEFAILAKTTAAAYPALQAHVRERHSYGLPCIVAWKLAAGLAEYLAWVRENVGAIS